ARVVLAFTEPRPRHAREVTGSASTWRRRTSSWVTSQEVHLHHACPPLHAERRRLMRVCGRRGRIEQRPGLPAEERMPLTRDGLGSPAPALGIEGLERSRVT